MCDTILAPPDTTEPRIMLFGKNSDRQRNEAQSVEYFGAEQHARGSRVQCQYIEIAQVERTHAMLLCRPFHAWGAEMGANEHGVVIGNEAVHSRGEPPQHEALTGNDLIRLALERAITAAEAVQTIISLLEAHGQGGNCGHLTPNYYNNGFLIADAKEAYVLETLEREWLVQATKGVRAISNRYSIDRADRVSSGLLELTRRSGWSDEPDPCYADVLANPHREHIGNAGARHACATSLLRLHEGHIDVAHMKKILRDHGAGERYHPQWRAECTSIRTLCMHAGSDDRPGQTAGSMVSELRGVDSVHWVTGTAAPCLSIFKPVLLDVPLPYHGPRPTDRFDSRTLWWSHEILHRSAALGDFAAVLERIRSERDALEEDFRARVAAVAAGGSVDDRARVVAGCWQEALKCEERWRESIRVPPASYGTDHLAAWDQMNRIAGVSRELKDRKTERNDTQIAPPRGSRDC